MPSPAGRSCCDRADRSRPRCLACGRSLYLSAGRDRRRPAWNRIAGQVRCRTASLLAETLSQAAKLPEQIRPPTANTASPDPRVAVTIDGEDSRDSTPVYCEPAVVRQERWPQQGTNGCAVVAIATSPLISRASRSTKTRERRDSVNSRSCDSVLPEKLINGRCR